MCIRVHPFVVAQQEKGHEKVSTSYRDLSRKKAYRGTCILQMEKKRAYFHSNLGDGKFYFKPNLNSSRKRLLISWNF